MNDAMYAVKISLIAAVGYSLATGGPTWIDPLLKSYIGGARSYPLYFWILLVAPLVLAGTYVVAIIKIFSWKLRATLPSLVILLAGCISLPNFSPGVHVHVTSWVLLYAMAIATSSWIRYCPIRLNRITDTSISESARIEYVKEYVTIWRTVSFALIALYFGLLVPWYNYFLSSIPMYIKEASEIKLLRQTIGAEIAVYTVVVLLGPISESFVKTLKVADLLLGIRSKRILESDEVVKKI